MIPARRSFSSAIMTVVAAGTMLSAQPPTSSPARCPADSAAVQVLGSGGPFAGGTRASTAYLVWRDGRAVAMIDAGGGSFLRFGESGARLQDLSMLAISHLHPDHVSDLPALLWLSEQVRRQPLQIAGPSGAESYPSFEVFLRRLFDQRDGAFPVLSGTLGAAGRGARLNISTIDAAASQPTTVMSDREFDVRAMGVPHGDAPSIAYRVRVGDRSVVFGSDQNGSDPRFVSFAADVDVLVMHLAVSQQAPDQLARAHARPSVVGEVAQKTKAKRLVLSHIIEAPSETPGRENFSLFDLQAALAEIKKHYSGPVDAAVDLQCFPIR